MASKIRQMFVMKSKIRHDVNKFVMKLKIHHDVKQFIVTSSLYKKKSRRPRVSNDYECYKNVVTNIRPIPVIFLDNFGMSVYSFVTIRPHVMV